MLNPQQFLDVLCGQGIGFYAGVPDSLLKDFCACLSVQPASRLRAVTAANEGAAVALAAGHYMASGKPALVYMQNSGEGNAVNPLASLTDPDVYGIPVLLLIGWRGQPGVHDEPQHVKQGRITLPLLEVLGIPYAILDKDPQQVQRQIDLAMASMLESRSPYALVVEKGTFSAFEAPATTVFPLSLTRETAVQCVAAAMGPKDVLVSTTGMASRELFEYREAAGQGHGRDFLCVGAMGHASQIALGIAMEQPWRRVWCLDGDGALLMHLGSLATIAGEKPSAFVHILLNNGVHDSVGGQPTAAAHVDFPGMARAAGYPYASSADSREALLDTLSRLPEQGPVFLEVKLHPGHRKDLGRPTSTPRENLSALMDFLQQ